jgi:hypothetical protein
VTETNVFELTQPGTFSDPLTEVLRNGARTLRVPRLQRDARPDGHPLENEAGNPCSGGAGHPFGSIKQSMNHGAFSDGLYHARADVSLTALVYTSGQQ